jgi:hypothetical protein
VSRTGSARARIQRRQLLAVVLVTAVIVPVFNVVTDRPTVRAALQGLVDAVLISMLVGGYLLRVREGVLRGWFRRRAFGTNLVINSSVALGLFLIGRAVGQVLTTLQPRRLLTSFGDAHLVYALPFFVVVVVAVQFVLQMNRVIGASVLRYFVTGVYHRPRAEERIFLFLDLEGSTRLAERLGSATYFELLRRFVDDLTEPVLDCEGGDLPVRRRRGRHHMAARRRRPRGQLRSLLLRDRRRHRRAGGCLPGRVRRGAEIPRGAPRWHRHRRRARRPAAADRLRR